MGSEVVLEALEAASEACVFAQPSDLQSLAFLHTKIEDFVRVAQETDSPDLLRNVARAAAGIVERIVLNEMPSPEDALLAVSETISGLQTVMRDGRPAHEVIFPALLGLSPASAGASGSGAGTLETAGFLEGDPALLGEFITEAQDHLQAADVHLLTLETTPEDQEALNAVFRAFHTIKGVAGFLALQEIQRLSHHAENLLDRARKGEGKLCGGAIDVVFDAVDALKRLVGYVREALATGKPLRSEPDLDRLISRLQSGFSPRSDAEPPILVVREDSKIGEILVEMGATTPETVERALADQKPAISPKRKATAESADAPSPRLGELLVQSGQAAARDVATALRVQKQAQAQAQQGVTEVKEPVKVDADRLDRLVDLIGELVIAESMVSQAPELRQGNSPQLLRHVAQLDKITRELQAMGTTLRMVPIRATFQKMARLARDVAKKANKSIEFMTAGEDTELDKSVVDKIGDPLVHMVRNAVDHGIEPSIQDRRAADKPDVGRVILRAFHKGGSIHIEIEDDGRGLDRDAILAKAFERGLIREGEVLTERETWNLIFQPGFSTAKEVTDVSGRGVGMDVVKRNVEALRGQIEVHSERGRGTVMTIRLPLTLAIIDGMVVGVGGERYVIPTLSIVRSIRPRPEDVATVTGRGEMLSLQEGLVPLFRLGRLFEARSAESDLSRALVVIAEDEGRRVGLAVDTLLGQQQIVIKSLGEATSRTAGIAGGAIMPDGHVGLILDVAGLVRLADTCGAVPAYEPANTGSDNLCTVNP